MAIAEGYILSAFFIMRLSYSDIKSKVIRNIQSVGINDANFDAEFNYQLGVYYQLMLSKLKNYKTYMSSSFTTVATTQYYSNPPGYVNSDGITITVGSLVYPLKLISSEYVWEQMNIVATQVAIPPKYYFPRKDDFGVWPIPQAAYTGAIYYHYRDRNLSVADVTGGSITLTSASATVTGSGTAFTAAMVGRWLFITDTTVPGQGYEYRISAVASTTSLTLARTFVGTTTAGITGYKIGETPEIPEDGHMFLADGVTAGYYKDIRKDMTSFTLYNNSFWTGDPQTSPNKVEADQVKSGLLGLINAYADREDQRIIDRRESWDGLKYEPWMVTLSS